MIIIITSYSIFVGNEERISSRALIDLTQYSKREKELLLMLIVDVIIKYG